MYRDRFLGGVSRYGFAYFNAEDGSGGGGGGDPAPAPAPKPAPAPPPGPTGYSKEFVHDLREEAKGWRLKATEQQQQREAAEAAAQQAKAEAEAKIAAAKADQEKAAGEIRTTAGQRIIRAELRAEAVKAGMIDLDGLKLADLSGVKINPETDDVEGAAELLAKLKEAKPYLFTEPKGTSNPSPAPKPKPASGKPALELSEDEWRRKLGDIDSGRRVI